MVPTDKPTELVLASRTSLLVCVRMEDVIPIIRRIRRSPTPYFPDEKEETRSGGSLVEIASGRRGLAILTVLALTSVS